MQVEAEQRNQVLSACHSCFSTTLLCSCDPQMSKSSLKYVGRSSDRQKEGHARSKSEKGLGLVLALLNHVRDLRWRCSLYGFLDVLSSSVCSQKVPLKLGPVTLKHVTIFPRMKSLWVMVQFARQTHRSYHQLIRLQKQTVWQYVPLRNTLSFPAHAVLMSYRRRNVWV